VSGTRNRFLFVNVSVTNFLPALFSCKCVLRRPRTALRTEQHALAKRGAAAGTTSKDFGLRHRNFGLRIFSYRNLKPATPFTSNASLYDVQPWLNNATGVTDKFEIRNSQFSRSLYDVRPWLNNATGVTDKFEIRNSQF
jgi:hypothetical protein